MAMESIMEMRVQQKKKFKGLPMFFTLENFKTALMDDIKL
jgi:hypothetical protein